MRTRIAAGLATLAAIVAVLAGGSSNPAGAQDKTKLAPPTHLYGHDVKVRTGGEQEWAKARKTGIEFFNHEDTKALIAISDAGSLAVAKAPTGALGADKTCKWRTAHDLACRNANEAEFTQKTKKFGVEMFQDRATNLLLYVCETGAIALAPTPPGLQTDKGPVWHHGITPRVRAEDQVNFENAKKFGTEIFKDENTGGLIYITEAGAIATGAAPAMAPDKKKPLAPKTMYGLVLRVRGADESDFTNKTKRMGVEVFEDPNAGLLFYITETGSVATAPKAANIPPDAKGVTWKSAMALRARKADEDFEKAKKYGVEVFEDNRTGNLIFISETGAIAVLPK